MAYTMWRLLALVVLFKWSKGAVLPSATNKNSSITLSQLEGSDFFSPDSEYNTEFTADFGHISSTKPLFEDLFADSTSSDSLQRQGRQTTSNNGFLPGMQRVPLSFQGFLGSGNEAGIGGVSSLTNGLDLETYTKNQAIRANQENAIVAQLSNMASVRKNQLARDISGGNVSATNELVSHLMRDLAVSPAGNMAFPSFADRASALSSESFGSQSAQQQQLMLARILAEQQLQRTANSGPQQQTDLNRVLQLQALNGNNPGVFNQLSAAHLLQQQQVRQQQALLLQQQQQHPNNPFLSPLPSLLNANNPIGLSNLPLQMRQLNNERLLRNRLQILSALNQQQQLLQQQQLAEGINLSTNDSNNNQQQEQQQLHTVNSILTRPSPSDLASSSLPRNPSSGSSLSQDNGRLKLANTKTNMRDLDTSSPFFPSLNDGGSGFSRNLGALGSTSSGSGSINNGFDQTSNEGFVYEVVDGFGRRLPNQLKNSVLGNKNETKKCI